MNTFDRIRLVRIGLADRLARPLRASGWVLLPALIVATGCSWHRDPCQDCITYPDSIYYGYYSTCWSTFDPDWQSCPPLIHEAPGLEEVHPGEEIELDSMPVPAAHGQSTRQFVDDRTAPASRPAPETKLKVVEREQPVQPEQLPAGPRLSALDQAKPRAQRPMARPAPREPLPVAPSSLSQASQPNPPAAAAKPVDPPRQVAAPQPKPATVVANPAPSPKQAPALAPSRSATVPVRSGSNLSATPPQKKPEPVATTEPAPAAPRRAPLFPSAKPQPPLEVTAEVTQQRSEPIEQPQQPSQPATRAVVAPSKSVPAWANTNPSREFSSRRRHGGHAPAASNQEVSPAPTASAARPVTALRVAEAPKTDVPKASSPVQAAGGHSSQSELMALKASFTNAAPADKQPEVKIRR